jgi:Zn-dependent peptidase ImmA (M78 family)
MDIDRSEIFAKVDRFVGDLLLRAGAARPPIDAAAVAEAIGFVIAVDERQTNRARHVQLRGYRSAGTPAILLRPEPRFERQQWAVAHEIGEHVAAALYEQFGIAVDEISPGERERAADLIAGRLLLPTRSFARDGRACDWDLAALKQTYATASHELIARRMLEFAPPATITIVDQGAITFRRSNRSGASRSLTPLEQAALLRVAASEQAVELRDDRLRVRAWPIYEPPWKREILRTEPLEVDDAPEWSA